ncbi:MAG: hypothetical protein ACXWUG_11900 [Polyangiales bacterium]
MVVKTVREHFEALFYVSLWVNASVLAVIVGRAWLGAIGLVTVAPFVVAYVVRARKRA